MFFEWSVAPNGGQDFTFAPMDDGDGRSEEGSGRRRGLVCIELVHHGQDTQAGHSHAPKSMCLEASSASRCEERVGGGSKGSETRVE